jgi:hypothetical protein
MFPGDLGSRAFNMRELSTVIIRILRSISTIGQRMDKHLTGIIEGDFSRVIEHEVTKRFQGANLG